MPGVGAEMVFSCISVDYLLWGGEGLDRNVPETVVYVFWGGS